MIANNLPQSGRIPAVMLLLVCLTVLLLSGCNSNAASSPAAAPASAPAHGGDHQAAHPTVPETTPATAATAAADVPHYYDDPEKAKPFPQTLDPTTFRDPAAKAAYTTARRIPDVLAQQPCYCFCDQGFGHGSLLHCHKDDHSAG